MNYWIRLVVGEFWAWKTYSVFYHVYKMKQKKDDIFVIANSPYHFVDLLYSSKEDLIKIFRFLVKYAEETNDKDVLQKYHDFRDIVLIIDEAHLYFFSRWFHKNFDFESLIVLTQLRKRRITIYLITQELWQIDSTLRRLVPYVRKYYYGFWFYRWYTDYYLKKDDIDIKDENVADKVGWWFISGWYLSPKIRSFLSKIFWIDKKFFSDFWTSYYIVWFEHKLRHLTYPEFLNLIKKKSWFLEKKN